MSGTLHSEQLTPESPLLASRGVVAERVQIRAGTIIKLSTKEEAA